MSYSMQKEPLSVLVSALRAVAHIHQSHHWQVGGPTFYSDHELLDELYKTASADVDRVAERAVGVFGPDVVDSAELMAGAARYLEGLDRRQFQADNTGMMLRSLAAELALLDLVQKAIDTLGAQGKYTEGVANLLGGIADRHEQSVYLLKRRVA